jgi:hypothetical protein
MFHNIPSSAGWPMRDAQGGPMLYMDHPTRYMADIRNPHWIELQRQRVDAAVRAGADALWIDNTFPIYDQHDVAHLIELLYETATKQNPHIVIMSNLNKGIYTWARMENAVTTEDGEEPGYYTDQPAPHLVTNAGLLRYSYGVSEGWRPVSVEYEGRHEGARLLNPMKPGKWQLAIAEAAMYHASLEIAPERRFLRDLYLGDAAAMAGLNAIGAYNQFLEENEQYYINPQSLARVAVLADDTDRIVPYLNQLSQYDLNYDVLFNFEAPEKEKLRQYEVIILPRTNQIGRAWLDALAKWMQEDGGTVITDQDPSLLSSGEPSLSNGAVQGETQGIAKDNNSQVVPNGAAGRSSVVRLPEMPAADKMVPLSLQFVRRSQIIEVEHRDSVLSNVAFQAEKRRIVLHLLNYRQEVEHDLHVTVRLPVAGVSVLSPDAIDKSAVQINHVGDSWELVIPEVKTYDLVAISLAGESGDLLERHQ